MHELLAMILIALWEDIKHAANRGARKIGEDEDGEGGGTLHNLVVSEAFLEHDAYALFCALQMKCAPIFSPAVEVAGGGQGGLAGMIAGVFELLRTLDAPLHSHLCRQGRTS